jgi:hypothetical protein
MVPILIVYGAASVLTTGVTEDVNNESSPGLGTYRESQLDFLASFREYFAASPGEIFPDPETIEGRCEEVWLRYGAQREWLYRMDSVLTSLHELVSLHPLSYVLIDHGSHEVLVSRVSNQDLYNLFQTIDALRSGSIQTNDRFNEELTVVSDHLPLIREIRSTLRAIQHPNFLTVPLFTVDEYTGFPSSVSVEALASAVASLRRVPQVAQSMDIPLEEKREFISDLMDVVLRILRMIDESPRDSTTRFRYSHSGSFPYECRVSADPLGVIERITESLISTDDFCRGLLFRYVSSQKRDHWRDSFLELYDSLERVILSMDTEMETLPSPAVRLFEVSRQLTIAEIVTQLRSDYEYLLLDSVEPERGALIAILGSDLQSQFIDGMAQRNRVSLISVTEESLNEPACSFESAMGKLDRFIRLSEELLTRRVYFSPHVAVEYMDAALRAHAGIQRYLRSIHYYDSSGASIITVGPELSDPRRRPDGSSSDSQNDFDRFHDDLEELSRLTLPVVDFELSMTDFFNVIWQIRNYFGEDHDALQNFLGDLVEEPLTNLNGAEMIRSMFGEQAGLRLLLEGSLGFSEVMTLKIFDVLMRFFEYREVGGVIAEYPEKLLALLNVYRSSSYEYVAVAIFLARLANAGSALSSILENVFHDGDAIQIERVATGFLMVYGSVWPKISETARDAVSMFLEAHRQQNDQDLFLIVYLGLARVLFDADDTTFCEPLTGARSRIDLVDDSSVGEALFAILLTRCPMLCTFDERMRSLRDGATSYAARYHISLDVSRANILGEAIRDFSERSGGVIREAAMSVRFLDEEGTDGGGLTREWFFLVAQALFDHEKEGFIESETGSGRYLPTPNGATNVNMEFAGKFIAKAIIDRQPIPVRFAHVVYMYILEGLDEVELDLEIYKRDFPEHGRSLEWLLANEVVRDLTMSVDLIDSRGVHRVDELIEGGSLIPVTEENKHEYIRLLVDYKLRQSIRPQLEKFLEGFFSVFPENMIRGRSTPEELELGIAGPSIIDVADLKAHSGYVGYAETSQVVRWFWEVVESYDQPHLALLLKFTTGSPLPPVGGFANLRQRTTDARSQMFQVTRFGSETNRLPASHTCFVQIDLPEYRTKEELEQKLTQAIEMGHEGFGFA